MIWTRWTRVITIWAIMGVMPAALHSPSASSASRSSIQRPPSRSGEVKLGANLVNTFVTVRDQAGRLVSTLEASDFLVLDDGVPQAITYFSRETQLPLSIALVIDRSQSVRKRFPFERVAATRFLEDVLRHGQDRALVVAFDSNVYLIRDFTDDIPALAAAIRKLTVAGGSSLFDAVYKTCRDKFASHDIGRKILIVVTDGEDTTSWATLEQASRMALQTDVIVYAIGIRGIEQKTSILKRLTSRTGGRVFSPKTREEKLAKLFARLQEELRNQYSIGYTLPHQPDGQFHTLTIRVKRKGMTVSARRGYYAPRTSP
ncbi:MAG: VWA domain-containing protein [Acidobacteria bacterium]|nr:MAG: VWA domain-containing protein [Acidobacteriota bacterium]